MMGFSLKVLLYSALIKAKGVKDVDEIQPNESIK